MLLTGAGRRMFWCIDFWYMVFGLGMKGWMGGERGIGLGAVVDKGERRKGWDYAGVKGSGDCIKGYRGKGRNGKGMVKFMGSLRRRSGERG